MFKGGGFRLGSRRNRYLAFSLGLGRKGKTSGVRGEVLAEGKYYL